MTDTEPLTHLPRLGEHGNPTDHALCDTADGTSPTGLLASSTWRANCPECEKWSDDGAQPEWGEDGGAA